MATPNTLELDDQASRTACAAWLVKTIQEIGPAFHPETAATDYITVPEGNPLFDPDAAAKLERSLEIVFRTLGDDLYTIAAGAQLACLQS